MKGKSYCSTNFRSWGASISKVKSAAANCDPHQTQNYYGALLKRSKISESALLNLIIMGYNKRAMGINAKIDEVNKAAQMEAINDAKEQAKQAAMLGKSRQEEEARRKQQEEEMAGFARKQNAAALGHASEHGVDFDSAFASSDDVGVMGDDALLGGDEPAMGMDDDATVMGDDASMMGDDDNMSVADGGDDMFGMDTSAAAPSEDFAAFAAKRAQIEQLKKRIAAKKAAEQRRLSAQSQEGSKLDAQIAALMAELNGGSSDTGMGGDGDLGGLDLGGEFDLEGF